MKKSLKLTVVAALAAVAAAAAVPVAAQFAKPEDAIKYRQSALFVMAQHFGRIGAMANGRVPYDAKAATENAEVVADMAKLPWTGFGPGYEGGKAKAEIWKDTGKFRGHNERLVGESNKLLAAAKTNNLDNVKTAFGSMAGACKACHDDFRNN